MRQGGPNRRPRGRHHGGHDRHDRQGGGNGGGGGGNRMPDPMSVGRPRSAASLRHQTFDSHCLDVRVRGNAWQVYEKYQQLARDAGSGGDPVSAENYLQHAEHYFRIIEAINEATAAEQRQRGGPVSPFGQQPEMPANYYSAEGALPQPPAGAPAADGANPAAAQQPQAAQAEVIQRQQQSAFIAPEESDDQGGPEPMVARR